MSLSQATSSEKWNITLLSGGRNLFCYRDIPLRRSGGFEYPIFAIHTGNPKFGVCVCVCARVCVCVCVSPVSFFLPPLLCLFLPQIPLAPSLPLSFPYLQSYSPSASFLFCPLCGQSWKSIQTVFISRFIILLRKCWNVLWDYFCMKE